MPGLASTASLPQGSCPPRGRPRPRRADATSLLWTAPTCPRCDANPDRQCPACATRRQHAIRLVGSGLTIIEAAQRLRVSPARVERLLEEARDRRDLASYARPDVD